MPLYSFDCPNCGRRIQKALVSKQRYMDCPACGTMMKRQDYTKEPSHLDDLSTMTAHNREKAKEVEWRKKNNKL